MNGTYLPDYSNISSSDSLTFIEDFKSKLNSFLGPRLSNFKGVNVRELSDGSVVVRFDIVVYIPSNATEDTIIQALTEANVTGALGYILIGDINVTVVQPESSSAAVPTPSTGTGTGTNVV